MSTPAGRLATATGMRTSSTGGVLCKFGKHVADGGCVVMNATMSSGKPMVQLDHCRLAWQNAGILGVPLVVAAIFGDDQLHVVTLESFEYPAIIGQNGLVWLVLDPSDFVLVNE